MTEEYYSDTIFYAKVKATHQGYTANDLVRVDGSKVQLSTSAPTTSTVGFPGQLMYVTPSGSDATWYVCTDQPYDETEGGTHSYTWAEIVPPIPKYMIFKGTLGTGGTISALPTASAANVGWTYIVITAGVYHGSEQAKVGDLYIGTDKGSSVYDWTWVPSGDETVTLHAEQSVTIGTAAGTYTTGAFTFTPKVVEVFDGTKKIGIETVINATDKTVSLILSYALSEQKTFTVRVLGW